MSEIVMMNFEEFRASCDAGVDAKPVVEAARQQREFLHDPAAAEAVLKPGVLGAKGWAVWDGNAVTVAG
ncbi:MAG: hypothetical protein M3P06_06230 [Acidobacteriota bacterium]|nr:hypothetical protein [Acidobacteriota bacterium]